MRHNDVRNDLDMMQVASMYRQLGYRPIPIIAGTKRAAIKWKKFQDVTPSEGDVTRWFSGGVRNIALLTGAGIIVVDVDDARLVDEALACCGPTPMRCRTPGGGVHLYYAAAPGTTCGNRVRIGGRSIDLRADGAYAVCPWSWNAAGVSYEWLDSLIPAHALPTVNMSWLQEAVQPRLVTPASVPSLCRSNIRRARAYLSTIEGAISGYRGHDRTFRVACVLAVKFGLSFQDAWPLLVRWNEQCEPPWSEKELRHKLEDALKVKGGAVS